MRNIVQSDILAVVAKKDLFDPLQKSTILITGATGLIGSMMIKILIKANDTYRLGIRIVGQVRNKQKAESIYGDKMKQVEIVTDYDVTCDFIVHTVSPTTSRYFIERPVETIRSSVEGTILALELAKKHNATMVYLSSMEQYGIPYGDEHVMTEDKIGIIDHLTSRSSYSESKRLCECLCSAYASEYGVDTKIARLAQTFGAGGSLSDNRMPMQFARSVAEGNNIFLHTKGKSISNFVYLTDAITGVLTVLEKGVAGQAYNICNDKESRSIREIAELVSRKVAGGKISVMVDIPRIDPGYAPDVTMYLNSDKLRLLGWIPEVSMEEAYRRLVDYILVG